MNNKRLFKILKEVIADIGELKDAAAEIGELKEAVADVGNTEIVGKFYTLVFANTAFKPDMKNSGFLSLLRDKIL